MFWTLLLGLAVCALLWRRLSWNTELDSLPKGGHVFQLITLSTSNKQSLKRLSRDKIFPEHSTVRVVILGDRFYMKDQIFEKFRENARVHGDRYMFRGLYRNTLHLSGPKDIETILSHPRNISKGKVYDFLEPWLGPGLLISSGTKWHKRRKILTPTFHFNILKNFATVIEEKSRDLVNRLKESESSGDGIDVDIMQVISDCTLYTICETAMGTQLDLEMSEKKTHYKKAILELGPIILDRVPRIWYHWDLFYRLLPIGRRYEQCLTTVRSFADDVIMDKKRKRAAQIETSGSFEDEEFGTKKRLAMLDLLLEAEAKGEIDLQGIRDEVNTFMFEGHDTTAMALTFAFMLLSENQEVQDRIYEELHSVLGDSDRVPNMADLAQLKYLEAVLKETLRLYPSVPFISRTITEEFQLGDLTVPKGTEVAIHFYDLHRRADLFPEPEAFRPERFLNAAQRHPYAFVPFSAGLRNCIGQRFAMQEMKCIVAEVVRGFRLEEPRARSPGAAAGRPRLVADLVLRPVDPIYVRFIKR